MRVRVGEGCLRVSGEERQGCGKCCCGEGISMAAWRGGQVRNMNDVFMIEVGGMQSKMAEGIGVLCKLGVEREWWGSIVRGKPRGLDLKVNREGEATAHRQGGCYRLCCLEFWRGGWQG